MAPKLDFRPWQEPPPDYVFDTEGISDLFSVEVYHDGFFCGLGRNLSYVSASNVFFDNFSVQTWSNEYIDEILNHLGYERDGKLHVYWCLPGKEISDGLVPIDSDAQVAEMAKAGRQHKILLLFIDHIDFLREERDDVIIKGGPSLPPIISPQKAPAAYICATAQASTSSTGVEPERPVDEVQLDDTDSDTDCSIFDSDCNAEDGDDDLFAENVDTEVNDHNEKEMVEENEDDAALDDEDLHLPGDVREKLQHKFRAFNPEVDMENPVFRRGLVFNGVEEARKALAAYAIKNRKKIRKRFNDKRRLEAHCEVGCPWLFKATKDSRYGGFSISQYEGKHTCESSWEVRAITANLLTETFMHEFRDNQKLDLTSFAAKITRKFNMCPDRWKLRRARKAALQVIHGDEEEQFSHLLDYGQELKRSNPGSRFFLTCNKVNDPKSVDHKEHLATAYWSYDACKRGFLAGCRPIICIDGCHIKTRYKGCLLTAVGIDPNDCIYPIAFGLVEVECTSSWEWFLSNLKDDLCITNTSPWTIMSDKQKGLINAVQKLFPDSEHRFCVRHLLQNFQRAGHRGETLKNDLWAVARSTNIPKWERNMKKMEVDSAEAYAWIEALEPRTWIKAFFEEFPKCDMLLNNHSEVFNSYINEARELPFLSMLESIFYKIMHRFQTKEKDALKWKGRICPKIKKKLDKFVEWSNECRVKPADNYLFAVSTHESEKQYNVDFKSRTCDCRRWQLSGIPCHHAIACCRHDNINPENFVHSCYTVDTYMKAYQFKLAPLRGRAFWERMNGPKIHPPLFTKIMGRPKKNRRKAPEEVVKKGVTKMNRAGVTMHCSLCGRPGHNKKGHKKFLQKRQQEQRDHIVHSDDELDMPYIREHVIPHTPNPTMDPTYQQDSMVFRLGQEQLEHVPISRVLGPLPENAFVGAARDSIPQARVRITTASSRGSLRGRGKGRGRATREQTKGKEAAAQQASSSKGRGRCKGNGNKRTAETAARGDAHPAETKAQAADRAVPRARAEEGYYTGPGSFYYMLFGDDVPTPQNVQPIPDLNAQVIPDLNVEEVVVTQNAPATQ